MRSDYPVMRRLAPALGLAARGVRPLLFAPFAFAFGRVLLSLALTGLIVAAARANQPEVRLLGHPPLQTFHNRDGGVNNFKAAGWNRNGLLLVAQDTELLEFDGRDWTVVGTGGPKEVNNILVSSDDDRVYVGGFDDSGYYEPDGAGVYRFVSMNAVLDTLPHDLQRFLRAQVGDRLYFTSLRDVAEISPRGVRRWTTKGVCSGVWAIGERLFVADSEAGLLELSPGGLKPAPGGGDRFTDRTDPLVLGARLLNGNLALYTRDRLFLYDGREFTPIDRPDRAGRPTMIGAVGRGWLAIQYPDAIDLFGPELRYRGTLLGLDRLLRLSPRQVIPGSPDGLWMGSSSGLVRLEIGHPASIYAEEVSLPVPLSAAYVRGERLLAITQTDTREARLAEDGIVGSFAALQSLNSVNVSGNAQFGDNVVYMTLEKPGNDWSTLRSIDGQLNMRLPSFLNKPFASHSRPDSLLFITGAKRRGLVARLTREPDNELKLDAEWLQMPFPIYSMVEEPNGTLWLSLGSDRVARARPPFRPENVEVFDGASGLPSGWIGPLMLGKNTLFETHSGAYEFDEVTRRFRPLALNSRLPGDLGTRAHRIRVADSHHLWISGYSNGACVEVDDDARYVSHTVLPWTDQSITTTAYQKPGIVWLATSAGLVRADTRVTLPPPRDFATSVRLIVSLGRERTSLFGGASSHPPERIHLPYSQNTLEIRLAADCWEKPEATQFQHRFGSKSEWSEWTTRNTLVKASIPAGTHLVEMRSRSADGRDGAPVSFTVVIDPPWHQTWWAYLLYALAATGALSAAGWFASRRHSHRARELEAAVEARTAVISRQSEEIQQQNARLIRAEQEREAAHRQFVGASRLAGMAEIASSVLHNVGNALNSISTSAGEARDAARRIDTKRIARAAEMVANNPDLFPGEKARQLGAFLSQIAVVQERDQTIVQNELARVREGIEHIEAVISAQQRFANAPNVRESVTLADLVESAYRLSLASFEHHGVRVETDIPALPPILTDKHKVLQILVNLLSNARTACDQDPKSEKRVTIRARAVDAGNLRLTVEDNGVGILPENLPKLFQSGFTTRKDGHGLGLHSSALAAHQLGGTLTAHSDGPGLGARFELTLPLQAPAT